jgi:hypothetical protein
MAESPSMNLSTEIVALVVLIAGTALASPNLRTWLMGACFFLAGLLLAGVV